MPRNILIVDDEPDLRITLEEFLKASIPEATVTSEADSVAALEKLWAGHVDLVVSDYRMPKLNGIAFLQRAKEVSPTTVRVLVSAYPRHLMESSEAHGVADRVFLKPLETQSFVQFVRAALGAEGEPAVQK